MPTSEPLVEVSATIEVVVPPSHPELYFWALQASFSGGGAGHTGLQWFPKGRGRPAVNWGGYSGAGRELDGSVSPMPSVDGNVNTRWYDWQPRRPHVLRVYRSPDRRGWRASIDGNVIRDLYVAGEHLTSPIVWSEVFAPCDHPSVVVRWSALRGVTAGRREVEAEGVLVNYQTFADGGCDNTNVEVDDTGVLQVTSTERMTPAGTVLPLRRR
jgi:hypothetical protein